jgi:hypothetical protein
VVSPRPCFFERLKLASESEEKTWTILPEAIQPFLFKVNLKGSPSERSEKGNPIFHPNKKGCGFTTAVFFRASEDMYPFKKAKLNDCGGDI